MPTALATAVILSSESRACTDPALQLGRLFWCIEAVLAFLTRHAAAKPRRMPPGYATPIASLLQVHLLVSSP